jgi:hypothetical protein
MTLYRLLQAVDAGLNDSGATSVAARHLRSLTISRTTPAGKRVT